MRTFLIVIERAGDNFSGYVPELPGCVATGSTESEVEANMHGAIQLHLRGMEEDGLGSEGHDVVVKRVTVASG